MEPDHYRYIVIGDSQPNPFYAINDQYTTEAKGIAQSGVMPKRLLRPNKRTGERKM